MKEKCPYVKCCKLYDKNSVTCNETGGDYYGPGRMAGCGRELNEKGKKAYCYKNTDNKDINKNKSKSTNWRWVAIGLCVLLMFFIGRMLYLLWTS